MVSTLEEDLLEIEQTLKAVEQKLHSQSVTSGRNSSSKADPVRVANEVKSFRGINKISQSPKKSVLLKRNISPVARKNKSKSAPPQSILSQPSHRNLSSTDHPQAVVQTQPSVLLSGQSIVSSIASLLALKKTKSKTTNLNLALKPEPADNKQKAESAKKLSPEQNTKPDYKLKLNRTKKGKLVHKFNSKHAHVFDDADNSNIVLVKSYKVKKAAEPGNQKQALSSKSPNKRKIKFNQQSPQPPNAHLSAAINMASTKLKAQSSQPQDSVRSAKQSFSSDKSNLQELQLLRKSGKGVINPPGAITSLKNHNLKEELIKNALSEVPMNHYYDHDQQKSLKKKYKIRSLRNLSLVAFILIFGGYLFFLNIPSISFRVAAIQAGMSSTAAIPAYKPAGYSLSSKASYGPGYVKIEMKNKNGNKLNLTQEKSSFDSEALKDNVVARADGGYSTYVKDGLTIYLYDRGGASWVNKGQIYNLSGDTSDLSSDEILNMAASM